MSFSVGEYGPALALALQFAFKFPGSAGGPTKSPWGPVACGLASNFVLCICIFWILYCSVLYTCTVVFCVYDSNLRLLQKKTDNALNAVALQRRVMKGFCDFNFCPQ